ncbi:MAG TPA: hypothetical protein DEF36_18995, partial [Desulfotomaculum sp.]|nr:hypothetical protein [Desulfotomaculum sp.]
LASEFWIPPSVKTAPPERAAFLWQMPAAAGKEEGTVFKLEKDVSCLVWVECVKCLEKLNIKIKTHSFLRGFI